MASLRDIRRRIASVKSTQKITRAMKMVATAKLRRAQEAILRTRPYTAHMRQLAHNLIRRAEPGHPLLAAGDPSAKASIIVITADRGLCGAFNASIVNEFMNLLNTQFAGRELEVTVAGRKGIDALRRRGVDAAHAYANISEALPARIAREMSGRFTHDFQAGEVGEVYCLYNEFRSAISQHVRLERILPFEAPAEDEEGAPAVDYLYEPSEAAVLDRLLTTYLRVQMQRILQESIASEHGARMTAMDAATNNAGDVIDRLTLYYNRLRQDVITKEVIEVVSGAEGM